MDKPSQDMPETVDMSGIKSKVLAAKTLDELFEILNGLPADVQKSVASLIDARSKEIGNDSAKK
jgi:hypothetical protein